MKYKTILRTLQLFVFYRLLIGVLIFFVFGIALFSFYQFIELEYIRFTVLWIILFIFFYSLIYNIYLYLFQKYREGFIIFLILLTILSLVLLFIWYDMVNIFFTLLLFVTFVASIIFLLGHFLQHSIILSGIYGSFAAVVLLLIFFLQSNYGYADGFFLLTYSIWLLFGFLIGLYSYYIHRKELEISKRNKRLFFFFFSLGIIGVIIFSPMLYLRNNIDSTQSKGGVGISPFLCSSISVQDEHIQNNVTKDDIVAWLRSHEGGGISRLATLYFLTGEDIWAEQFRDQFLKELDIFRGLKNLGSVKSVQEEVAVRGYFYLLMRKENPNLFSENEEDKIINYFKLALGDIFQPGWVDYLYAIPFQMLPEGPYLNQEIGVAALSVANRIIKEEDKELYSVVDDYINKRAIGWSKNFRNPDDSIEYQSIWINNAYLLSLYNKERFYNDTNARNSFEWILNQLAPNNNLISYDKPNPYSMFDTMALGAYLFRDGRYKWFASQMFRKVQKEQNLTTPSYYFGLMFWDDDLEEEMPHVGSCFLKGTSGFVFQPGGIENDKIVLRDGWSRDSLYTLLNLRFHGWHSYKATNTIVSLIYGVPFVVEDVIYREFRWLPEGKKWYTDRKIDRYRTNGAQMKLSGIGRVIFGLIGMQENWYQDLPSFAEVKYFQAYERSSFSHSIIRNWHGWNHERIAILKNSNYIAFFDFLYGNKEREVGINWHLRGDAQVYDNYIALRQDSYKLDFYFPHRSGWYNVEVAKSEEQYPAVSNSLSPSLDIILKNERGRDHGYISLFIPQNQRHGPVTVISVFRDEYPAYPQALAIRVDQQKSFDIIGSRRESGLYNYSYLTTDAESFIFTHFDFGIDIDVNHTQDIKIPSEQKPSFVSFNQQQLVEGQDWFYRDATVVIKFHEISSGEIKIKYAQEKE